jgi:hypothetical protein
MRFGGIQEEPSLAGQLVLATPRNPGASGGVALLVGTDRESSAQALTDLLIDDTRYAHGDRCASMWRRAGRRENRRGTP